MGERIQGFVPFGEYKPDLRYLANDGLVKAEGVVPVYGDYISSPALTEISANISTAGTTRVSSGLHVDPTNGNGYAAIIYDTGGFPALKSRLYEITEAGVVTDRSKVGDYINTTWFGCSYGAHVVMCGFQEITQFQANGGAVAFADMITSTFAPRGTYPFVLGPNLFMANCTLAAPYDTLAAGANPTLVVWSRNDNIQQFGSQNANPEIIGSDYQPLNFDIGNITGAVSTGEYGLVAHTNGLTVVEGPPYSFRVVHRTAGCLYPYSLCAVDQDVYFWGPSGLSRFRGGAVETMGVGRFIRSILDNATGFSAHPFTGTPAAYPFDVSIAYDATNGVLFIGYTENGQPFAKSLLAYNVTEDRLSWFQLLSSGVARQVRWLRAGKQAGSSLWCPGRDIRFVNVSGSTEQGDNFYSKMSLGNNGSGAVLQKGYMQLKAGRSSRFLRLRPVYSVTDQAAIEQVNVTIESTNKPYATAASYGPYTSLDTHGWLVTPETMLHDFHAPKFTIAANANIHKLVEYQGFEYEAELGPDYAA